MSLLCHFVQEHAAYRGDLFTILKIRNSFTELGAASLHCPHWYTVLDILPDRKHYYGLS